MGGSGIEENKEENTLRFEGIIIPKRSLIVLGIVLLIASAALWSSASFLAYDAGFKEGYAVSVKKCGIVPLGLPQGANADGDGGVRLNVVSP